MAVCIRGVSISAGGGAHAGPLMIGVPAPLRGAEAAVVASKGAGAVAEYTAGSVNGAGAESRRTGLPPGPSATGGGAAETYA